MKNYFKSFFKKRRLSAPIALPPAGIEVMDVSNVHDTSESYIHLPIEIDLKYLEGKLNNKIRNGSKIIDMPDYRDLGYGFGVPYLRIYKLADLKIAEFGGKLHVTLPIEVEFRLKRTTSKYFGTPDFENSVKMTVKMVSPLVLSDNLELEPSLTNFTLEQIFSIGKPRHSARLAIAPAPAIAPYPAPAIAPAPAPAPAPVQNDYGFFAIINNVKNVVNTTISYVQGGFKIAKLCVQDGLKTTKDTAKEFLLDYGAVPISNIVLNYLNGFVFQAIAENFLSRDAIARRLSDVCWPKEVNTNYHIWYAIQPLTIYMNKPTITLGKIKVDLEVYAKFETSVGEKPYLRFNADHIRVESRSIAPLGDFKASMPIYISYSGITEVLQKKMLKKYITAKGLEDLDNPTVSQTPPNGLDNLDNPTVNPTVSQTPPVSRSHSIREKITKKIKKIAEKVVGSSCIQGVNVSKGPGSMIMIKLKLKGAFNGDYTVAVSPVIDAKKQEIHFDDYRIDQRGIIRNRKSDPLGSVLKIADVFFHDRILKLIKQYLVIPLDPYIAQAFDKVYKYVDQTPQIKDSVELELTSLSVSKINLNNNEIVLWATASGKVAIRLRPESA